MMAQADVTNTPKKIGPEAADERNVLERAAAFPVKGPALDAALLGQQTLQEGCHAGGFTTFRKQLGIVRHAPQEVAPLTRHG